MAAMSSPECDAPAAGRSYRPVRHLDGLRLMHCRCRAGAHERPVDEQHLAFSVTLVERGSFTYRTGVGGATLRPGWLMLGNAGAGYVCSHEDSDGTGDDCVALSLSASVLESAQAAWGDAGATPGFARACLPPVPRVAALFSALRMAGGEGFALEEAAFAAVGAVRRASADDGGPAPATSAQRLDDRARAAAHCIETRAAEALSLEDVAQAADLSAFHLLRVFHRALGVTPHQYLMRQRLLRAIALLRDTALPVTMIAYEAGWADLSNFNRAFRREVGCSPREFRQADPKMARREA